MSSRSIRRPDRFACALLIASLWCAPLAAKTLHVKVEVEDAATGRPIAGAHVSIELAGGKRRASGTTDAKGLVKLPVDASEAHGNVGIAVTADGYQRGNQHVPQEAYGQQGAMLVALGVATTVVQGSTSTPTSPPAPSIGSPTPQSVPTAWAISHWVGTFGDGQWIDVVFFSGSSLQNATYWAPPGTDWRSNGIHETWSCGPPLGNQAACNVYGEFHDLAKTITYTASGTLHLDGDRLNVFRRVLATKLYAGATDDPRLAPGTTIGEQLMRILGPLPATPPGAPAPGAG